MLQEQPRLLLSVSGLETFPFTSMGDHHSINAPKASIQNLNAKPHDVPSEPWKNRKNEKLHSIKFTSQNKELILSMEVMKVR